MSGAIVKVNGVGDEVVKLKACGPACKREGDNVGEAFRYSSHAHIVDKLLFDRIGEGALNIKEERRCYFTLPPRTLDLCQRLAEYRNPLGRSKDKTYSRTCGTVR